MDMNHSVRLDKDKCMGCTTCIKQCPTEAIRVRQGKAKILADRCVDCGHCVSVCPHHAKMAVCDPLSRLSEFKYTVALPAPSLYGQFRNLNDINIVLGGLLEIGFNDVYEVARAAEEMSAFARNTAPDGESPRPVISVACPACVRLICRRFPKLVPHLAPEIAPVELAALAARAEAIRKSGLQPHEIGVFFITPCPAKMTSVHQPLGLSAPVIDGAFSMTEVYIKLLPALKKVRENPPKLQTAGMTGINWAASGGESMGLQKQGCIAVDGIPNVISVLEDIEDGKLPELEFVELGACTQGCVGGCLAVENPYVSLMRIRALAQGAPKSADVRGQSDSTLPCRDVPLEERAPAPEYSDFAAAIERIRRRDALLAKLPGLDCASCGAPSCEALAEDVVSGFAQESDCIFLMREKMGSEEYLPPPFRRNAEKTEEDAL